MSENGELRPLDDKAGFYGDARLRSIQPADQGKPPGNYPVSWLMSERLARAWLNVIAGMTVEDTSS